MIAEKAPIIEAMPLDLIIEPLDWIFAEHFRQRQLCTALEFIASSAEPLPEAMCAASAYLEHDMPLHVEDEEEDLFPLVRKRCTPEDEIENVLSRLARDHEMDKDQAVEIAAMLFRAAAAGRPLGKRSKAAKLARSFAQHQRHHLVVENAVVLPIARLRLRKEDLKTLSRHMAVRRGIALPEAAKDVRK